MNYCRAMAYLARFLPCERIGDIYEDDEMLQMALAALCPGFEYPDHSHRTIREFANLYRKR